MRKDAKWPATERELAHALVQYWKRSGWEVHEEVSYKGYSSAADIIAYSPPVLVAVECKKLLSWEVIEQADAHKNYAHRVYVATPHVAYSYIKIRLLQTLGIGYLQASPHPYKPDQYDVVEVVMPELRRRVSPALKDHLVRFHRNGLAAGSAAGARMTPFRSSLIKLAELVEQEGPMTLYSALERVDHHWRSSGGAARRIRELYPTGAIREFQLINNTIHPNPKSQKRRRTT